MDRSIRDKSRRRRFLLASVTAAGAFVVVYFANAAYHELLLDKLGLSQALVDALGAAAAVLVSFLAQEALSIARYRDATYGAENALHRAREEAAKRREAATAVSDSLAQVPHLNNILVGQLGAVTSQTESAAFGMVERLQAVDAVVQDLDGCVQAFSQESGEIVEAASARAARNQQTLMALQGYIHRRLENVSTEREHVMSALNEAKSLGQFVKLVHDISSQTNLLAQRLGLVQGRHHVLPVFAQVFEATMNVALQGHQRLLVANGAGTGRIDDLAGFLRKSLNAAVKPLHHGIDGLQALHHAEGRAFGLGGNGAELADENVVEVRHLGQGVAHFSGHIQPPGGLITRMLQGVFGAVRGVAVAGDGQHLLGQEAHQNRRRRTQRIDQRLTQPHLVEQQLVISRISEINDDKGAQGRHAGQQQPAPP